MAQVSTHKIGDNRGRRRIWLDGKRLVNAGFLPGMPYWLFIKNGVALHLTTTEPAKMWNAQRRKVSGKEGSTPVIDIVGGTVSDTFGKAKQVKATWSQGRIIIEKA